MKGLRTLHRIYKLPDDGDRYYFNFEPLLKFNLLLLTMTITLKT